MAKKRGVKKRSSVSSQGRKNTDFASAVSGLDKAWSTAKKTVPTNRTTRGPNANVPDGSYAVQVVEAATGVPKNGGNAYFRIRYVLLGELEGESVTSFNEISDNPAFGANSEKTKLDLLSERLQLLGVDTAKIKTVSELEKVSKKMSATKVYARVGVRNRHIPAEESRTGDARHYQDIFVNEVIKEDELNDVLKELS